MEHRAPPWPHPNNSERPSLPPPLLPPHGVRHAYHHPQEPPPFRRPSAGSDSISPTHDPPPHFVNHRRPLSSPQEPSPHPPHLRYAHPEFRLPELRYPPQPPPAHIPLHPTPVGESYSRRAWDATAPSPAIADDRPLYEGPAQYITNSSHSTHLPETHYRDSRKGPQLGPKHDPYHRDSTPRYPSQRRYSFESRQTSLPDMQDPRLMYDRYREGIDSEMARDLRREYEEREQARREIEARLDPRDRHSMVPHVRHPEHDVRRSHTEQDFLLRSHYSLGSRRVSDVETEVQRDTQRRRSGERLQIDPYAPTLPHPYARPEKEHFRAYIAQRDFPNDHQHWDRPNDLDKRTRPRLPSPNTLAAFTPRPAHMSHEPMSISLLVNSSTAPGSEFLGPSSADLTDSQAKGRGPSSAEPTDSQAEGVAGDWNTQEKGKHGRRAGQPPQRAQSAKKDRKKKSAVHNNERTSDQMARGPHFSSSSKHVALPPPISALTKLAPPDSHFTNLQSIREPHQKTICEDGENEDIGVPLDPVDCGDVSSDPDDLDTFASKKMSPKVKKELVRYMMALRERKRKVLARYEKRHHHKLERLQKKLKAQHGIVLDPQKIHAKRKRPHAEDGEVEEDMEAGRGGKRGRYGDEQPILITDETPEMRRARELRDMEMARKNMWLMIVRRDVPKAHQIMLHHTYTKLQNAYNVASLMQSVVLRARPTKQQLARDLTARTKRAAKEMLMFWKRNEKEERELRKKAEKEKLEQRKREEEIREAQRQARKLNFLITQTELYSHFVGRKLAGEADKGAGDEPQETQTPVEQSFEEIDFDAEDDAHLNARAAQEAQAALAKQRASARAFDDAAKSRRSESAANLHISEHTVDQMDFMHPTSLKEGIEVEQPRMLTVTLKSYQLKGLSWLAGLWEQGINGILADEMGLGKTIQSIALMAHLAETHDLWGPFLVVSPASTLPNWQQEIARFTPGLKVLPYWGDPDDRKVLRSFLNPKKLGVKSSPFHVAITSYQLIVTDWKYFARCSWQYMILDEAQAIKSSSSLRWKSLLKLPSRNRLLLTGTPIQNSMQELWSLLHFIMPTLFDSHEEFSDWFSKDIESHVGGESEGLNEEQLRRLHMILKPFMLRRVKRDVENELAEKIEIEVPCSLTCRQKTLYQRLKGKISFGELMSGVSNDRSFTGSEEESDTLMNIVMQFRKVCNHPELFERAAVGSPFYGVEPESVGTYSGQWNILGDSGKGMIRYRIPRILWQEGIAKPKGLRWPGGRILSPSWVWQESVDVKGLDTYSFLPFIDTSISEFSRLSNSDLFARWVRCLQTREELRRLRRYYTRNVVSIPTRFMLNVAEDHDDFCREGLPDIWRIANDEEHHSILVRVEEAYMPSVIAPPIQAVCSNRSFINNYQYHFYNPRVRSLFYGDPATGLSNSFADIDFLDLLSNTPDFTGVLGTPTRKAGWTFITIPSPERLITDSGKMLVLDRLLPRLKAEGHRVLIFFQMTLMMDLMEEYLAKRQYSYLRLDGSTSIMDRRDLVSEWQSRADLFIFMLSTRAGGLGINLTAADTVIFYDSDWNPTVDQQAMDRSHRLGQTKQVTVYRLITTGTIEERILQRARQKDQIQKVVISGGEFKQQVEFKPKEVLSLLLEDEELEEKLRKETARRQVEVEKKEKQKALKAKTKSQPQAKRKPGGNGRRTPLLKAENKDGVDSGAEGAQSIGSSDAPPPPPEDNEKKGRQWRAIRPKPTEMISIKSNNGDSAGGVAEGSPSVGPSDPSPPAGTAKKGKGRKGGRK